MPPVARLISLGILITLIVALGITFYQVLAPFLLPLFLAWIVAIVCRPLYLWCVRRTNNRPRLAAGITTTGLLLVVLLPFSLGTVFASVQLIQLAQTTLAADANWRTTLNEWSNDEYVIGFAERIEPYLKYLPGDPAIPPIDPSDVDASEETAQTIAPKDQGAPDIAGSSTQDGTAKTAESVKNHHDQEAVEVRNQLQQRIDASLRATFEFIGSRTIGFVRSEVPGFALGLLGHLVSLLVAAVMFSIGLYYFLCDGPDLLVAAENLIPVQRDYQRQLLTRFNQVVRAVVLSTFLSALAQGVLTTFALGIAGFDHLMALFVLASLVAMIPVAGTWVVWVPCVLWLVFFEQSYVAAGLVTLFCAIVVGTVDNLIRTFVLNNSARLHPLLAFVSVLGGLQVMGLWGVFIGPIVAACLHALVQIFNMELTEFSNERQALAPAGLSPNSPPSPSEPAESIEKATEKESPAPAKQQTTPESRDTSRQTPG